jgi:hypothetical protein
VKGLPIDLEMTDTERLHWEGEFSGYKKGKKKYRCHRIELNALATTPQSFIDYVEGKLELHGLTKNLVPPEQVVLAAAHGEVRSTARQSARDTIEQILDLESLLGRVAGMVESRVDYSAVQTGVSNWGHVAAAESWRDVTAREAEKQVRKQRQQVVKMVRESLANL